MVATDPALMVVHRDDTSLHIATIPSRSLLPLETWWNSTFSPTTNTDPSSRAATLRGIPSAPMGADSMNAYPSRNGKCMGELRSCSA